MEVSVTSSSDRETAPIETSASQNGANMKKSSARLREKTWTVTRSIETSNRARSCSQS